MDTHISTVTDRAMSRARVVALCAAVLLLVAAISIVISRVIATLGMPSLDDVPEILLSFGVPSMGATWASFIVADHLLTYGLSQVPVEIAAALVVGLVSVAVMLLHRALELSRRGPT